MHNVSPATRLLEKQRQMFEVQEALEIQKQEFARKVRNAKTHTHHRQQHTHAHITDNITHVAHTCTSLTSWYRKHHASMLAPQTSPQEEAFRKREEALKQRDLELQESLIRFSKFLQENDSKRARAEKKAAEEARARQAKEAEITKLNEEMDQLTAEKERADGIVDRRMRCE